MNAGQGSKKKILVVDDNSENIRIIGSILRQNNFNVGFATRGQQALDLLKGNEEEYDLVLLDVNMPEMNGLEVCQTIRKNGKLRNLPVIFLTANTLPEQIVEGFVCGGQDYVTKPFNSDELLARINTHLELKDSRKKLQLMNEILEEKVKERTIELEASNQKLTLANLELQKLDEAKAGFLRLISHEINTPLNGIIGFADILKEQLLDTDYFYLIEILSQSAYRLNEFSQSSLIITQLRTSPEEYKKEQVDVKEVILDLVEEFRNEIEKKNIGIDLNWISETTSISGNWMLIRICMKHLFRNAIQFTPEKKSISISGQQEATRFVMSFEDHGPGFSENVLSHIFEPFSTVDEHIDRNKGLGLSIVKMILDFHQAQIHISNKEGGGSLIKIVFNH